ncbi:TonB-dependent receptor [Hymenobacter glaciei]|uniref:TonB-dependent receptor n=1 Tax=Hymenobacter glaciei TaxID=877209 RepID=A0ABP7ULQ0_9BACT
MRKIYSALVAAALAPTIAATAAPGATPVPHHVSAKAKAKTKKLRLAPDPTGTHIGGAVLTNTGDPLPGATVFIKGTYVGTSTNQDGHFDLNGSFANGPVELLVSYVGYETQSIILQKPEDQLNVSLVPSATMLSETVVSASRVEENIMRAPVTIDKVSAKQVERISTPEVLAGLGNLAGIDVNSASMLFTSVSTRGFNTAKSERVIQLVDYMDTALPSLNLSPGNMVGIPELDMESIEIVHGPASALYGSNALSGVVLFNSKDPFVYEGLSVRLRGGQRSLLDGQLRYAHKITDKLAFKVNASYFRANDWIANDFNAQTSSTNPTGSPLGYDAVNRYGELDVTFAPYPGVNPELYGKRVYIPGYTERDLVAGDTTTRSYRVQGAVSYLFNSDLKLTFEAKRGVGTSTYQNLSRFRIKDLGTDQYRLELKSSKGFIRAYTTEDFTGSSYELTQLSTKVLQSKVNPANAQSPTYAQQYFGTYNGAYTYARQVGKQSVDMALASAQAAANATLPVAGSDVFNSLRNKIAQDNNPMTGAGQHFNSRLSDVSAQRSFVLGSPKTGLIVGAAYRQYMLGSGGVLFDDLDGKRIPNYEYGSYAQITHSTLNDHLKLALAGRVDFFKNFNPSLSPRVAAVYSLGGRNQHNFRASYGQAFRSPSQTDQFLHSDVGSFILLGNIGNGYQGYGFTDAKGRGYNPYDPTMKLADFEISIDKLRLERVNTYEVGYKGAILPNVYVDASYFNSRYNDFIGGVAFIGNLNGSRPSEAVVKSAITTGSGFNTPEARIIFVSQNNSQVVRTQGVTFALTYYLNKALNLTGNYSLNVLDRSNLPIGFRTYFNTPKHKYNLGVNGIVAKNLNYTVNYRWIEGHQQEMPFAAGEIATYRTTDAYVGYTIPKLASTLQVGGSNIFNANNIQIIGGPQIGRLIYLGLLVNVK